MLQKEHHETLAKINFVLALSNCILDLAASRTAPLAALVDSTTRMQPQTEMGRKGEQLALMMRALQLISSGVDLATKQLQSGQLQYSSTVKNGNLVLVFVFFAFSFVFLVLSTLNRKFRTTLMECKKLDQSGVLAKVGGININADKILYNHAIEMVRLKKEVNKKLTILLF